MASVKVILRTNKQNKEKKHPLAIQIIKDRKPAIIHISGIYLSADEWDDENKRVRKSHPNSARINNLIKKKLAEASDKVLEVETKKGDASVRALKNSVKPKTGETFFAQADDYILFLEKSKKFNIHSMSKPCIKKFKEFLGGQDIYFSDITVGLLESFKAYLKSSTYKDRNGNKKFMSDRTGINHFVVIRSVYAHARKNNQVIPAEQYPFGKGKFKIKFPSSKKIGLNEDEVKLLENAELEKPQLDHARDVWLLSLYFAGTRIGDTLLLKKSDFQDDRLRYTMEKNDKDDSLKIPSKALKIINKYRENFNNNHDLLFPDLDCVSNINDEWEVKRRIKTRIRAINEYLREVAEIVGIEKKLTMHISRHTFGNLSGDKIPIQMLQKLYRHTHISTTIGYQQNFIHKDKDAALENVIGF